MIGTLRRRVTIEAPVLVPDGGGGSLLTWTPVATVWARVKPLHGVEEAHAMQERSRIGYRITLRYRGSISARHRVVMGSRIFNVRAVLDAADERNRYLTILAEEGVAV